MRLKFLGKKHQLSDIWTFSFEPADNTTWWAGQSIRLELPVGYDEEEKRFTISSAPYEQRIDITTRQSGSAFKRALASLKTNQQVDGYGVEGDFVWMDTISRKLFVAFGLGVTPFHAILRQLDHEGRKLDVDLVHAAREGELMFAEKLEQLAARHDSFGYTTALHLEPADLQKSTGRPIYLSGPEPAVRDFGGQLQSAGVPEALIKYDLFTGLAE